jgi:hypothetical protein
MAIGEAGSLNASTTSVGEQITVTFIEALTEPVFAFSATANSGTGIIIRLVDQTYDANGDTTSFSFILEEWEYQDDIHDTVETVNWLAFEQGVHTLADGRIVEAGTTDVSSTTRNDGDSETFSANFTDAPVVLTSVMSNNDTITVDSDPSNITSSGFDITLQEKESQSAVENGAHGTETIGWIAIQAGSATEADGSATTSGTASATEDTVTHAIETTSLGAEFDNGIVLLETQILHGTDTATVSIDSVSDTEVTYHIDKETSANTEVNHTTEIVGVVAFESGLIPCFTRGSRISVGEGLRYIEDIGVGDQVLTEQNGKQTVLWAGRRYYNAVELAANPKLRPVRITAGSLGDGLPVHDLLVSRQHRMLVRSKVAERMFGQTEVLIAAIKLTALPGIYIDEEQESVEYFHLLFRQHEVIYAEGAPTESLFTGPAALDALTPEARTKILTIFPEVADLDYAPQSAKYIPAGYMQKRLISRRLKNNKALLR